MNILISPVSTAFHLFRPKMIPGLLFHLDAGKGISLNGGAVSAWADQSGNNYHFIQNTAVNQPQYVAAGSNNRPVLRFNGSLSDMVTVQTGIFSLQQAFSVFAVIKRNAATFKNYETLLSQGYGTLQSALAIGFGNSGQISPAPALVTDCWKPSGIQSNSTFTATDTSVLTFIIGEWQTHKSAGTTFRLNGSAVATKSYGSGTPNAVQNMPLRLGSFGPTLSEGYFEGDIAELLCYNRAVTEAEFIKLENYLLKKYGKL